jgi:ubiquitin C-terminal hydrolase
MVKRFRMSSNGSFKKINTPINISQQINIGINGVTSKYNLVGIGNHYGVYGGGHYTAHVLENNNWMCCDDIHRSVIDISQDNIFVNNTSAYIVCYELV